MMKLEQDVFLLMKKVRTIDNSVGFLYAAVAAIVVYLVFAS